MGRIAAGAAELGTGLALVAPLAPLTGFEGLYDPQMAKALLAPSVMAAGIGASLRLGLHGLNPRIRGFLYS